MRVLILSAEVWRNDKNGGNVLSNIFEGLEAEFAQVYCNPGEPNNCLCKNYYQMTDSMVLRNILKRKEMGRVLTYENFPMQNIEKSIAEQENKKVYNFFRKFSFEIFHAAKEMAWWCSKWKNENLKKFVLEFNPDVIFAPCYGSHFMLALTRYVGDITGKPIISYISDDHYTLNQFRFSPTFWINRWLLRRHLRKTFPYYSLIYTMTQEQKEIYDKALHCNMKILKKSGNFQQTRIKSQLEYPLKIIYAGGIYCGRVNTLMKLAKVIKELNVDGKKFELNIYTGNAMTKRALKILNDRENSTVNSLISKSELEEEYSKADIALHVESFQLKYKKMTRLSFSTKIMDCLESGAAVVAIADKKQSGLAYLSRNDIGLCVHSLSNIKQVFTDIADNPKMLLEYAQRAYDFCSENHNKELIASKLQEDFYAYANRNATEE